MNRLIYWLCEELVFVMIYQCHHCCVLLLVRRQHNLKKNIFVRESTLFPIQKTVVLLLERYPKTTKFHGIKRLLGWYHLEGYGLTVIILRRLWFRVWLCWTGIHA